MLNKTHKGEAARRGASNEKTAAVVTIFDAGKMSPAGRKRIAAWLRNQADMILTEGDNYSDRFRGRYLYNEGKEA